MPDIIVGVLSLLTIFMAVGVVVSKEAVHSALCLTTHLLGVGGIYLALNHQFMAVAQLLVYAGAVMVVFMFAVTTLNPSEDPLKLMDDGGLPLVGILVGSGVFASLLMGVKQAGLSLFLKPEVGEPSLVTVQSFALDLFGPYLLPFEGTALVLLTALIGAIILGGRRQMGDG